MSKESPKKKNFRPLAAWEELPMASYFLKSNFQKYKGKLRR